MGHVNIRKAELSDASCLTELTIRSKAIWGYSNEQLEMWRDDLTISHAYIGKNQVYILEESNTPIAYYSYILLQEEAVELDNMFVDTEYIGKGYGKVLMQDFLSRIKMGGIKKVILYSEPKAESFYKIFGFEVIGRKKSSVKDRFLPIMELVIDHSRF